MILVALTFLAAFLIEGLGTLVSVIGLSSLFGANPIIIALAVALDVGKLVTVSLLYTYWKQLGVTMRAYALAASVVTMVITSAGAAGYLSGEFQKAILGTQEIGLKVDVLKQEQAKLEARKKQIDDSIAQLPEKFTAAQRIRMINQFKEEQKQVTARLNEISKQLPEMQISQIGVEAKAGPILYISKAFNISVEEAVKWVILLIIFVFDPLAVFLIIAGNFLLRQRALDKAAPPPPVPVDINVDDPAPFTPPEPTPSAPRPLPPVENDKDDVMYSREPMPTEAPAPETASTVDVPLSPAEAPVITRSSLTSVRPDPSTVTDTGEIGINTGVYRTGQSK